MGGTQLGCGTKSSSFSGREAWGGGQGEAGVKAGLASQLDLPLWVSACLGREGTLLNGWGGVWSMNGLTLSDRDGGKAKMRDVPSARAQRRNVPLQRMKGGCGRGPGFQGL